MSIKLAYHANCWGPLGGHPVGVTSIGSLTYMTFSNLRASFEDIKRAGYDGVEIFDGNLLEYQDNISEFNQLLDDTGLELVAVYSGANLIFTDILDEELIKIQQVAELAAEAGAIHLVVGGGAKRRMGTNKNDRRITGEGLQKIVKIALDSKLIAHYHPHLTTLAETSDEISEIFSHTEIQFCPDTAHLAAAGSDVSELIHKWRGRISYVHLKGLQKTPFKFTPLDEGDLDISKIITTLKEVNYQGWITTELDAWTDPFDGALRSYKYLTKQVG